MGIWTKDGKLIVDSNGKPIVCNDCPCGGVECRAAVDAKVAQLLALKDENDQYIWAMGQTYSPQYTCAVWSQDSETQEWSLVSMAEGKLVCAFRVGTKVSHTTDAPARKLVYAKTLYSSSLDQWMTVGCECRVTNYECKHTMVVLDDYNVGGMLDVWKPDESDSSEVYTPSRACEVDICELAKLKLEKAHDWHYGSTMLSEGYYDWWSSSTHTRSNWNITKYIKAVWWNDYETQESESVITTIDHWKLTYISCSCSSEFPSHHEFSSDEKYHSYAGICDIDWGNCIETSLFTLRSYLDEEDSDSSDPSVWEEVASVATDFTCGTYENGECVVPSSGHVVVVAYRPRWMSNGWITPTDYYEWVDATTIHNKRTGVYRTIGCKCVYENHECTLQSMDSEYWCIAGVLPVRGTDCSCYADSCDILSLVLDAYAEWYNGMVYGEGFIQHMKPSTPYDPFDYELFSKCIVCPVSESDSSSSPQMWYSAMNCSCLGTYQQLESNGILTENDSVHELSGVCNNQDCLQLIILKQTALDKGWTWHDECVLVHLAYYREQDEGDYPTTYGDWYMPYTLTFSQYGSIYFSNITSIYMGCAETPDGYYLVGCNCGSVSYQSKTWSSVDIGFAVPSNFWWLIDFDGACNCLQFPGLTRELISMYPTEFGIEEIAYGNDSKYDYTRVEPQYDMMGEITGYTTVNGCKTVGFRNQTFGNYSEYNSLWIDYRTFCFIGKCFDHVGNQKVLVRGIYPQGSKADPTQSNNENGGIYDSAQFNGHVTPFAHDNDIGEGTNRGGWDFAGMGIRWGLDYAMGNINPSAQPTEIGGYWSQEQAEIAGECDYDYQIQCLDPWTHHDLLQPPLLSPNTSIVTHNCVTRFDSEEYEWYVIPKWWGVGYEYEPWRWQIYNVQWIYTNKGLLVRGVGGYQASYTTAGSSYQECGWEYWHDPDDESDDGTIQPRTITCPVDEDMHSCVDFDFDDGDDSESLLDDSESASASNGD